MEEDLPLFAIAKQIQHQFPNENGKDIYFWFREGHLEKVQFNMYTFFSNRAKTGRANLFLHPQNVFLFVCFFLTSGRASDINLILQDCGVDIK